MLYCSSILAQLIWRSSHGVISNKVHVPNSAWPATHPLRSHSVDEVWPSSEFASSLWYCGSICDEILTSPR